MYLEKLKINGHFTLLKKSLQPSTSHLKQTPSDFTIG